MFEATKVVAKAIYDGLQMQFEEGQSGMTLTTMMMPELIVDDFDEEQVWAGVEMMNRAKIGAFNDEIGRSLIKVERDLLLGAGMSRKRENGEEMGKKVEKKRKTEIEEIEEEDDDEDDELLGDEEEETDEEEEDEEDEQGRDLLVLFNDLR